MLKTLKQKPLLTSLLIVLLYACWFLSPLLFGTSDSNLHGTKAMTTAGIPELITASALVVLVTILGWWKNIGFRDIKPGGLKFIIPIVLLIVSMLGISFSFDESGAWFLGFHSYKALFTMLGTLLLLGFVEEGIFRGVLFYGLKTTFTPFYTVLLSALIFGLFHFVNLLVGADFTDTVYQVIHASAMGFLYASLRLKLGAIWPLMLLHTFWDFSLFVMQSTMSASSQTTTPDTFSIGTSMAVATPALAYGLFVYWRWSKTQQK